MVAVGTSSRTEWLCARRASRKRSSRKVVFPDPAGPVMSCIRVVYLRRTESESRCRYPASGVTQKLSRHAPPGGTLCNS